MSNKHLSTDSYKGVRDFYPEDAAIQQYIFTTWAKTAESFGYERYDASLLEPSDLYRAKGAVNEEMVNDQTYTFTDRGDREVTLRPEMTPSVARMVAGRARALSFPLRWYAIPNCFRYERMQKGRLREFWQLNCDIFGTTDYTADIEMITLAYQTLIDFGAKPEMFEIQVNDRKLMDRLYLALGVKEEMIPAITRLNDRRDKIDAHTYRTELKAIVGGDGLLVEEIIMMLDNSDEQTDIVIGLAELGITNVVFNKSLARGFDYYTGTIFEVRDVSGENPRALLGGGRYDNLTELFGGEAIPGIGFGLGDVVMRDFLETHKLLPVHLHASKATLAIIPTDTEHNLAAQKIAKEIRDVGIATVTDIGTKKVGKKISDAVDEGVSYIIVVGEDEVSSGNFVLKNLKSGEQTSGPISKLIQSLS
ncbi:MAG: histidyl-tRNA synthetase, histidyl-tRNA synthetase [Candidatus Parcubacteria bacterium]|jgi:histidyl-tRNA synthetase